MDAAADFSRILDIQPDDERAQLYRGIARLQAGDLDRAKADFYALIERSTNHRKAHYLLGLAHYRGREHKTALAVLSRALELLPQPGLA